MAEKLLKIAADESTPAPVRLAAIRDALDRAGVSAKNALEVTVGPSEPWVELVAGMVGGSRAESRAARGVEDSDVVDADWMEEALPPSHRADAPNTTAPAIPVVPQHHLDAPEPHTGGPTGPDGASGRGKAGKRRRATTDDVLADTPIVSLDDAHPEPEPKRQRKNPAITPKMRDPYGGRRSRF